MSLQVQPLHLPHEQQQHVLKTVLAYSVISRRIQQQQGRHLWPSFQYSNGQMGCVQQVQLLVLLAVVGMHGVAAVAVV